MIDELKHHQWDIGGDEARRQQERDRIAAEQPQRPYDPTDAVMGEMLREVLLLAKAMEEMRQEVAALRAEIAERKQPTVVAFPGNALKFSR
jgi:hypothetical protein